MPDKQVPRSHGSFGHIEEFGEEFNPEDLKNQNQKSQNGFGSTFKKMKDKAKQVARQNLE